MSCMNSRVKVRGIKRERFVWFVASETNTVTNEHRHRAEQPRWDDILLGEWFPTEAEAQADVTDMNTRNSWVYDSP